MRALTERRRGNSKRERERERDKREKERIDHEYKRALQRPIGERRDDLRLVIGERLSRGTDGTKSYDGSDILRGREQRLWCRKS